MCTGVLKASSVCWVAWMLLPPALQGLFSGSPGQEAPHSTCRTHSDLTFCMAMSHHQNPALGSLCICPGPPCGRAHRPGPSFLPSSSAGTWLIHTRFLQYPKSMNCYLGPNLIIHVFFSQHLAGLLRYYSEAEHL